MIVTRQCNTERQPWSSSKLGEFYRSVAAPRMSHLDSLSTQPDWREQDSPFGSSLEAGGLSTIFDEPGSSDIQDVSTSTIQRRALEHRHTIARLETSATGSQSSPTKQTELEEAVERVASRAERFIPFQSQNDSENISALSPNPKVKTEDFGDDIIETKGLDVKEDEDEDDAEDDDLLDLDETTDGPPKTEAERRADRRKMKRFRLTHQQTRFLMSEFAKQAHPDAAHRERLSKEIPGLSPRQVQVWFQNRRAKIKRLTVDDRERMMKMRAVPDDFDNVQALHSPYGAVNGTGTPIKSPIDYNTSFAGRNILRPLMVDTMRHQSTDEHISPTSLSPDFGHAGFASTGSLGTIDVLSPLSTASNDRFFSPISASTRSTNPFSRQNSTDSFQFSVQQSRHSQPLQLRDTLSRSRSDSLQSPLRTSMSWKGNTLDYSGYSGDMVNSSFSGKQQSSYQGNQGISNLFNNQPYETNSISNTDANLPASLVTYSTSQAPALRTPSATRYRTASLAFPSGLDLPTHFNALPLHANQMISQAPRVASFSNSFSSGGFPSAPLLAPAEYHVPQTPMEGVSKGYTISQLSAPMASSQEFSTAYTQSLRPGGPSTSLTRFAAQHPDNDNMHE